MSTTETRWGTGANAEATAAWDGPLYDRFVEFRHLLTDGLGRHGEEGLRLLAPQPGERVLDVGCGFGDTTQRLAGLVGRDGVAVGVDVAPRFIETATAEAAEAGVDNARFVVADVQLTRFEERFDRAYSRMGTMFFANPVPALRNVREALVPGGRLAIVVWRRREDNAWVWRAQQVVEQFVRRPEEHDDPTCGPGPFSMQNADTTSDILLHAGFRDVELHRCDKPTLMGRDMDEAVRFVMSLGPAGEILRLAGESAAHLHGDIEAALREAFRDYETPDGELWAPASTWIVSASAPGD